MNLETQGQAPVEVHRWQAQAGLALAGQAQAGPAGAGGVGAMEQPQGGHHLEGGKFHNRWQDTPAKAQ